MPSDNWYEQLSDYLRAKGHSDAEVEKILARVKQYDVETRHDSIMESIESGHFDLGAIIKEALGQSD